MPKQAEFAMLKVKDFQIFRAGDYQGKGKFTEADIAQIVGEFNERGEEGGIIVGHLSDYKKETAAPAFGWITRLKQVGDQIWTDGVQFAEELIDAIKDGYYGNRSVGLAKEDGKWIFTHLGILGGAPPAVTGMKPSLKAAVGFAKAIENGIEVETEFANVDIEEMEQMATDDTLAALSEEFATCLKAIEAEMSSTDENAEADPQKCFSAMYSCYDAASGVLRKHFDFMDKTESIAERFMARATEMSKKIIHKFKPNSTTKQKESTMDTKEVLEFAAEKEKLATEQKALADRQKAVEAKEAEFSAREKTDKDKAEAARAAMIEAQIAEFKKDLTAKKYPVAKMEEDGVFALAKKVLEMNELEFSGKKKAAVDLLPQLAGSYAPVETGSEFSEDEWLVNVAIETNSDPKLKVNQASLQRSEFARAYVDKHSAEVKGATRQEKIATVIDGIMGGRIKLDPNLLK